MAKVPRPGAVKTRLEAVLSPELCADLALALLFDALAKSQRIGEEPIIAFFPPGDKALMTKLLGPEVRLVPQSGGTLGERMFSAFDFAFSNGADSVVMIGTDSPTFPADYIEQAFSFLETESDVVLGRTSDGGFYLVGLRRLDAGLFANVRWSSPNTFDDVYRNAADLNLHLREVPAWYDIDEPQDLKRMIDELKFNSNARRRAAHVAEWLETTMG